ncbi:hypothetical protein OSB04_021579 [Centaurea solstitialis]|uniref:Macrophage migration inhibitory factor n=1 Tax=Centaurea solstitialis TaxID=347529 RepID=A0AA38WHW2_9ASTR|nr:hypothetical protein OSB04_021579 [Centaurea solstitialis]
MRGHEITKLKKEASQPANPIVSKMPCLNLSTNVNLDAIDTSSILSEATSAVAKLIGKPEAVSILFSFSLSYVMIVLKGSVPIAFGGTEEPAAYGELVSIGGLNADVNKKLSAEVAGILESKLSVPKSRFFLKFYDTKASYFSTSSRCVFSLSCTCVFSFQFPVYLGSSKSRKCTVSACFTPVLDHVNHPSLF